MIFSIDFAATAHFFKKHFFIYIPFWKKLINSHWLWWLDAGSNVQAFSLYADSRPIQSEEYLIHLQHDNMA